MLNKFDAKICWLTLKNYQLGLCSAVQSSRVQNNQGRVQNNQVECSTIKVE